MNGNNGKNQWPLVALDELCDPKIGARDPRNRPNELFVYVDISSVDNKRKQIVNAQGILGREASSRARQVIAERDVLVATTRPNLNAVALVPREFHDQIASTGFCVLRPGDKLDPEYLFSFVQTAEFVRKLSELVKGALYPAVTETQVRAQRIPLPPLDEQRRIAARLREQLSILGEARAALEAQFAAAESLTAAHLRAVFESEEAQAWPRVLLGDACEIQLGKMLSPASKLGLRPVPYFRNANVQWGRFDLRDVVKMDFDEKQEAKLSLRAGDLLVCEGGEPGRAAVWNGEIERCCYQKALHRLRPINGRIDPYFVMYRLWLAAFYGEFFKSTAKSTIAHLPAVRLAKFDIPLPRLEIQRMIARKLEAEFSAARALRDAIQEKIKALDSLPVALLGSAFGSTRS